MHASGVTKQEAVRIFDLLYNRCWSGMGAARVLGDSREALRTAYAGSLIAGLAPHFWLELPLLGEPHSDLHVSYDYTEVQGQARFDPGDGFGYQGLFDWFAREGRPHTGIDLTFDLGATDIRAAGAYVSFHDARKVDFAGFCTALGRPQDEPRCRAAAEAFPEGWRVWYASPFLGRAGIPVRAAALATNDLKARFAHRPALVREHLQHIGIATVPRELCELVAELAKLPVYLEWRITLDGQGAVRDRLDLSFYLSQTRMAGEEVRQCFSPNGAGTRALGLFEAVGGADSRWRDVVSGAFARIGPFTRDDGSAQRLVGVCSPSCFMQPWEQGRPLAAKAYPKLEAFFA